VHSAIPINVGLLLDSKTLGPFAVARCIVNIVLPVLFIVVLYMQQNKCSDSDSEYDANKISVDLALYTICYFCLFIACSVHMSKI